MYILKCLFVPGEDPSIEVSSSQPSHVIYEKEEKIKIDYSGLTDNLQDLDDGDDVRKVEKNLEKQINEVANTIQRIQVRNIINSKNILYEYKKYTLYRVFKKARNMGSETRFKSDFRTFPISALFLCHFPSTYRDSDP